jgi:hypothetical protein
MEALLLNPIHVSRPTAWFPRKNENIGTVPPIEQLALQELSFVPCLWEVRGFWQTLQCLLRFQEMCCHVAHAPRFGFPVLGR